MPDRQTEELARYARSQGWEVETTAKGHYAFVSPRGDKYFTSGTASDWRSHRNFVAELRRAGLAAPPKNHKKKERRQSSEAVMNAIVDGIPFRDVESMPRYPYIDEMFGQWRTEDWFDTDHYPLSEDEWGGPDDNSILAALLADNGGIDPKQDTRTDKVLRTQFYVVKYWGGLEGAASADSCTCGFEAKGQTLRLGRHLLNELEAGHADHEPAIGFEALRPWTDPSEVLAYMDDEDPELQLDLARGRISELEIMLVEESKKVRQAESALSEIVRLAKTAIPNDQVWS